MGSLVALLACLARAAPNAGADAPGASAPEWTPAAEPEREAAPVGPDRAHLAELVARSRALRLAEDPGWLRLGHWRRTVKGGFLSEVDGTRFFRSLVGKTNPRAELEATLRGFFDARPVSDELADAQCRFPARLAFLAKRLGVDHARLPLRRCARLEAFLEATRPRSVALVFSSYYLNNPASAFGHTFLRLIKAAGPREERAYQLLDHGVDYSATVTSSNPIVYALAGLLGFFEGHFNHHAYYYKVREYADAESRDLWEYELALAPEEVALLATHLWELGATHFDYWYLDENCSYQVLGALEAAAPRLELLRHVGRFAVLPSDTVKALLANAGLVRAVHFRPSVRWQFESRVRPLGGDAQRFVSELGRDPYALPSAGLSPAEQAGALEAAADRLDLRFFRDIVVGRAPRAARDRQVLLERRSALGVQDTVAMAAPPTEQAPHLGHGSSRAGLGGGHSSRDGVFATIDLRFALHDLGDPPAGYPPLVQIEFFPARVRAARSARLEIDEAWLLRIVSLNALHRFDLRPSWRLRMGAAAVRDGACANCLAAQVEFGTGFTKVGLLRALDLYAGLDATVEGAPRLSGVGEGPFRAGLGPGAMLRVRAGLRAALVVDARWRWLPDATPDRTFDLRAALRFHLANDLSLALESRRTPGEDAHTATLLAYY